MKDLIKTANRLINEKSPYLLQHAYNPVDWYPWCDEAFAKAKEEDKPIFLSIGYSCCHWCHVMEHESFKNAEVADRLNKAFISIKVDREERPDIDSVYMSVCQALTGSGGWPMTIIMTPECKPFFAGTYFPRNTRYGVIGITELLELINEKWTKERKRLLDSSEGIIKAVRDTGNIRESLEISDNLISKAFETLKKTFDRINGGFGHAPKFPTPHNLIFLAEHFRLTKNPEALEMVEKTLTEMYYGGIFDHIGNGFSRYSTDDIWLVPHFEKMLYDNALLIMAFVKAYEISGKQFYRNVTEKIIEYIFREMTDADGGFYCAQDADSDGVEGKYYVFTPDEIINVLGKENGERFNKYFDITEKGNFDEEHGITKESRRKSIPNLRKNKSPDGNIDDLIPDVYNYRKQRANLHKDDKFLTSWNSLMISALISAYSSIGNDKYLKAALKADQFISDKLTSDGRLRVSCRNTEGQGYIVSNDETYGFLDDYAYYINAQIGLYEATYEDCYLQKALKLTEQAISEFYDHDEGGFFMYGRSGEQLILKPKETYDGAIPSGNSVMAYNLVKLARLAKDTALEDMARAELEFISAHARKYPAGHCFFLYALQKYLYNTKEIVCVLREDRDLEEIKHTLPDDASILVLKQETREYPLLNGLTTFYVCENNTCLPPVNSL